jgi:hypothetical protein
MKYEKRVYGTQGQIIGSIYAEDGAGELVYQLGLHPVHGLKNASDNLHVLIGNLLNWNPDGSEEVIDDEE